jgi:hypothetical protein
VKRIKTHIKNMAKKVIPTEARAHPGIMQTVHMTVLTRKYASTVNTLAIAKSAGLFIQSLIILCILMLVKLSVLGHFY